MEAEKIREREARWDKIAAFSRLTPEAQKLEMERLCEKPKAIDAAIVSNQKASETAENEKRKQESEVRAAKDQYAEMRNKRQRLFAEGIDTKDLDAKIWKLHLDIESREALRADAVAGFEGKILDLRRELELLQKEKEETLKTILEFQQVPLIPKFNEEMAQAMATFEKILDGQDALNYDFQYNTTTRFRMIVMNEWGWVKSFHGIGKIYLMGCYGEKDSSPSGWLRETWSLSGYYEQRKKR